MINNIQILRAFAAINVVLFHIIGTAHSYAHSSSFFLYLQGWGANGVDIFFVISGFVMLHTQMLKRKSPLDFFKNRLIRIVPIYWVLTMFVILLYLIVPTLFREMIINPIFTITSLFFSSFLVTGKHPVIYVGWTLEWEMLFYIIFAIGLFFKSWRLLTVFVVTALVALSVATKNWIVIEFVYGMLVAYIYHKGAFSKSFGLAAFLLGALVLLLSVLPFVRNINLDRVLIWGVPSFLIVLGAVFSAQIKSNIPLYLGDASYSIYLSQTLTIPAFYKFSSKFLDSWNGDILIVICLFVSVVLGCFVYSILEKPITAILRSFVRI